MTEQTQILIKCRAKEYTKYFSALLKRFGNDRVEEINKQMVGLK